METIMYQKSVDFSLRIVKLYKYLIHSKRETIMSKQLLRSGTSIGANLAESAYAESRQDLRHKQQIALKECSETLYWLQLLHRTGYLTDLQYQSISSDADELRKLLSSSTKTLRENP